MKMVNDALHLDTPIAGFNGGRFYQSGLDGYLLSNTFGARRPRQPSEFCRTIGSYRGCIQPRTGSFLTRMGPHVARESWTVKFEAKAVKSFAPFLDRAVKIVGVSDDLEAVVTCEAVCQKVLNHTASAARSQPYYLDITHPQATKGGVVA